jgi:hypothetical protein|tara:strand:- start:12234 stop:12458 length:225 start_codon:yes stop_codon:yes gene_type:complete
MAKTEEGDIGVIEKLAVIADAMEDLFSDGKIIGVFELKKKEFKKVQKNFRDIDRSHTKFKIDISGIEFVFILDE